MQSTNVLTPRRSRQRAGADNAMTVFITIFAILVFLLGLGWVGLLVKPASFPLYPQGTKLETTALPQNLPAPVERFYQKIYGEQIPVITSAVITGRATMRIMGITFPARFRFTHEAGQNYRHYIETTWFGFPIMKVNESYLGGNSRMELPFGVTENEPKINQAANLGLWSETIWFPAYFLTDDRVRWEAVDDLTAFLVVPFGETYERFLVRFDSKTGLIAMFESMRYRDAKDQGKILWLNDVLEWDKINGYMIPKRAALTWFDQGTPWANFTVEDVVYNSDVRDYVRAKGL
jgi:hypothetical protein